MEIHEVEVKGVHVNVEFWLDFQTYYPFIVIATESNFVFDILL